MRNMLLNAVSRFKMRKATTLVVFSFCACYQSYFCSWLQIFRPFHVASYPAVSELGIISLLSEKGPTSGPLSSELSLTGEPLLPPILGFKQHTLDQTRTCAHCSHGHIHFQTAEPPFPMQKARTNEKPQHPPRWKIESWSFCSRKLTD